MKLALVSQHGAITFLVYTEKDGIFTEFETTVCIGHVTLFCKTSL